MKTIKVLQLIDSLNAGGGERMAVQLANALSEKIERSALVCTRHSGILEKDISSKVKFLCLNKTHSLDIVALKRLRRFVKKHDIKIIHAHSTSFFMASLLKLYRPQLKLIWHDHYGLSDHLNERPTNVLMICSYLFDHILCVNHKLKIWSKQHLKCKQVNFIHNFSLKPSLKNSHNTKSLKGSKTAYKIIHVANLRPQKDHITALKALKKIKGNAISFSYHLIGAYEETSLYFREIRGFIKDNHLEKEVFIYGCQSNINQWLQQADMGLLSSVSEGLPVSLIEYAQAKLPVVVTDVGQCQWVVGEFAKVVKPQDEDALSQAIQSNINHPENAKEMAFQLYKKVSKEFDADLILLKLLSIYDNVLK